MKSTTYRRIRAISAVLACAAGLARAQGTGLSWPGCADLQAGDFEKVTLSITHPASPTKMLFAPDGRMFFASTNGTVWTHNPTTQATATIAAIPVKGGGTAWGLIGIALDPNFAANNWVYLLYSANPDASTPANKVYYQLWRYTLVNNRLDVANGIKVIQYLADNGAFPVDHSGGGMAFDQAGNLYFSTGENSDWNLNYGNIDETRIQFNSLRTAGNANDLRGKVNRIHPEANGTYTIPAGNLFPPGTDSTRPEIYAMGFRNPWSLSVDKRTGLLLVADVGPQAVTADPAKGPAGMDEFDAIPSAGNYGWPMFMGPNLAYNNYNYAANTAGAFFDSTAPRNNSALNTGRKILPPSRSSTVAYGKDGRNNPWTGFTTAGAVPISGPMYRYDGANPSRTKFPPHFEGKWFVADAFQKWIKVIGLDAQGARAAIVTNAFPGMTTFPSNASYSILAMAFGPDGALYVSEYQSSVPLYRIEYTGTCLPATIPTSLAPSHPDAGGGTASFLLSPHMGLGRTVPWLRGRAGFSLYTLRGECVWRFRLNGSEAEKAVNVPTDVGAGMVLRGVWE